MYGLPTLVQGLNASEMVIAGAEGAAGFSSAFSVTGSTGYGLKRCVNLENKKNNSTGRHKYRRSLKKVTSDNVTVHPEFNDLDRSAKLSIRCLKSGVSLIFDAPYRLRYAPTE
jgi:hypothetical protein